MSAVVVQAVFLSDPSAALDRGVVTAFAALRLLRLIRLLAVIKVRDCRAMHSDPPARQAVVRSLSSHPCQIANTL